MKRLTTVQKEWLKRHAHLCHERHLRGKDRKRAEKNLPPIKISNRRVVHRTGKWLGVRKIISAPSTLSLTRNFAETVAFFRALEEQILKPRARGVMVDFAPIKHLAPAASLMLAAALDWWQRLQRMKLRIVNEEEWDPEVRRLLRELGLFGLLETPGTTVEHEVPVENGLRLLKFISGEGAEGVLARELENGIVSVAGPIDAPNYLYDGLTEAMTNVAQHAYRAPSFTSTRAEFKRWWMTGSFEPENHHMKVIILDRGVGIPETLPRSSRWERVRGWLAERSLIANDHAAMIAAAMETSRTSTDIEGRGHGLDDVRRFIDNSVDGRLRVISGRGQVTYHKQSGRYLRRALPVDLGGTLIEWEVWR